MAKTAVADGVVTADAEIEWKVTGGKNTIAIEYGSNLVRVGTGIFGPRSYAV